MVAYEFQTAGFKVTRVSPTWAKVAATQRTASSTLQFDLQAASDKGSKRCYLIKEENDCFYLFEITHADRRTSQARQVHARRPVRALQVLPGCCELQQAVDSLNNSLQDPGDQKPVS